MDFQKMLDYVTGCLENSENNKSKNPLHSFRNRASHTKRIYEWGKVILPDFPNINKDVALTACIFHDIGYINGKENHAHESALMFKKYAEANGFDSDFINKVYYAIDNHSNKELIKNPNSPQELVLLLEADLMDEEGALGIVWDLMAFGASKPDSYYDTIEVLKTHSAHIINQDYMVTPIARYYWEDKKRFVIKFIEEIEMDLFLKEKKNGC